MNPVVVLIGMAALLTGGVLLCIGLLGRVRATVPASSGKRRRVTTGLGIALVGCVCIVELRNILDAGPAWQPAVRHRLIHVGDGTSVDQLQILVIHWLGPALVEQSDLHEILVEVPGPGRQTIEFSIDDLGLRGELTLDDGRQPTYLDHKLTVSSLASKAIVAGRSAWPAGSLDLGDGRPFAVVALALPRAAGGLGLVQSEQTSAAVLVRPLCAGDQLGEVAHDELRDGLTTHLQTLQTPNLLRPLPPDVHTFNNVARLLALVQPLGVMTLAVGLLLFGAGRLSLAQNLVAATFGLVILISGYARLGFSHRASGLTSADAGRRQRAAVELAQSQLFPVSAGRMLVEQFRREPDAAVRATIVLAAAGGSADVARSEALTRLLREADADAAAEVRRAAARVHESQNAAGP